MLAGRHGVSVDLRLDVGDALGVLLQPRNVDLAVVRHNVSRGRPISTQTQESRTDMSK